MSTFVKKAAVGLCSLSFAGCAAGYHAYPHGCVPYADEPPAPLPYTQYSTCPTPIASRYFQQHGDTNRSRSLPEIESEYYVPHGNLLLPE